MSKFKDEDKDIANIILCKICKNLFKEPIKLPCSENICRLHLNDFIKIDQKNNKKYFDCVFCEQKHFIEKEVEFNNDKTLLFFCNLYRKQNCAFVDYFNECKESFQKLKDDSTSISSGFESELIEYFGNLRLNVDLKREELISKIHQWSDDLMKEINEIEKSYLNKLKRINSDFDLEELKTKVKNYEKELNKYEIDLDKWTQINENIKLDLLNLEKIKEDSNEFVTSKEKIKFKEGLLSVDFDLRKSFGRIDGLIIGTVISCSFDNTIKIWNYESGECIKTINDHSVRCLELLDDYKIASGSWDMKIKIWDLRTFQCLKTLNGHSKGVVCIKKINNIEIMSGSYDSNIKIWNIVSNSVRTLEGHVDTVNNLEITNDKKIILSCSDDRTIKIWNYEFGKCLRTLTGHSNWVTCLTLINNVIISGSADKTIKIWNFDSGDLLNTLTDHNDWVIRVKPFKKNQFISGSQYGDLKLWDFVRGICLKTIKAHAYYIWELEVSADGRVFSGSEDKTIKIWNMESGKCLKTLTGHSHTVSSLILIPNSQA